MCADRKWNKLNHTHLFMPNAQIFSSFDWTQNPHYIAVTNGRKILLLLIQEILGGAVFLLLA